MNTDDQAYEAQCEPEALGGSTSLPDLISEAGVAAITGLPPQAQRSFWKAFGRVCTAGAEWPANYLEGRAKITKTRAAVEVASLEARIGDIKSEQKARDVVNRGSAKAAVEQFSNSSLAERAVAFHGRHILIEQSNREDVIRIAAEDLRLNPPETDSNSEIGDDWLYALLKEASARSDADYKEVFGRILSGEIKQPGSFSIGAIQAFARLDKKTADTFQRACNLSTIIGYSATIVSQPFARIGANMLSGLGLSYEDASTLIDAGLLRNEFNETNSLELPLLEDSPIVLEHAGRNIFLLKNNLQPNNLLPLELTGPSFTRSGAELRRVVTMESSEDYLNMFAKWLHTKSVSLYVEDIKEDGSATNRLIEVKD